VVENAKGRILIADDSRFFLQSLERLLQAEGYEVFSAVDGHEAVELARVKHPDVILLDIEMPHVDGRDVLSRLRDDERLFDVPVFVISGRDDDYTRENVIRLGARDLIGKPVDPEAILRRVRRVLST